MEIECGKTAVWRVAATVRRSAADGRGSCVPRKSIAETARGKLEKGVYFGARDRGGYGVESGEGFELERVVSCGSSEQRWRTKLDFCRRKPLDDHHRSTTLGAAPEIVRFRGVLIGLCVRRCT